MSQSRAKAERRANALLGNPEREAVYDASDLPDTREQRRQKKFKPASLAAEMRATDPKTLRKRAEGWNHIRVFLDQPGFRAAIGDPCKKYAITTPPVT